MVRVRSVFGLAVCCWATATLSTASARAERELGPVELVPMASGRGAFVTFGYAFRKGDVRDSICMEREGQAVDVQVDSKRHHEDGSLKHAIITAYLPAVSEGQTVALALEPAAARPETDPPPGLPDGLEGRVVLDFPDGSQTVADLRRTFAEAQAHPTMPYRFVTWLSGPLVTEYQVSGPPMYPDGRQDPDLWVTFGIRVYRGMDAARVEVVVENSWVDSPGNVPYKVRILIDGNERYANEAVGHVDGDLPWWLKTADLGHSMRARWRKVFWWGRPLCSPQILVGVPGWL